jgi:hypothetical protein
MPVISMCVHFDVNREVLEKKGVLKAARVFGHPIAILVKNGYATDVCLSLIYVMWMSLC